ncbi:tyrosine-protein phosphatase [Loktanella sp. F6476L]|uniref:tyrosine-protein phosphatase n=1 Tax=Loktanella sp. F6476L TaxID=2926405 RepID=UPI001FF423A1|nr:tyrosine-protein phosphatase [Loktanella sp. F6476L]MCK0119930.1 tyrosine-protein phosphatase [Loktanella sp. F6476L]
MAKRPHEIDTPEGRARALRQFDWQDHDVLRRKWHNFEAVADGVYRSNQPSPDRFAAYAEMGIKTILNLRGGLKEPFYLFEKEACDALGLKIVTVGLSARKAPQKIRLIQLFEAFETIEKPFLIHCKSGADRTGLASAFYLLAYSDVDDDTVRAQLSFRYLHIRKSSTGILDYVLETYLARRAQDPIDIRTWVETEYDEDETKAGYAAMKAKQKLWEGW